MKKKSFFRVISLILVFCMLVGLVPMNTQAAPKKDKGVVAEETKKKENPKKEGKKKENPKKEDKKKEDKKKDDVSSESSVKNGVMTLELTDEDYPVYSGETQSEDAVLDAAIIFSDLHSNKNDYKGTEIGEIFGALEETGLPFSSVTSAGDAFSVNEDNSSNNGPYTGYTYKIRDAIRDALNKDELPVNYTWSDHDRYAVKEHITENTTGEKELLDKTSQLVYGAGADGEYGTADDGNYYVYTLSMGDLCSYDRYVAGFSSNRKNNGFTESVETAIANFEADAEKLHKDRPLFITSHQPLFDRRNDNAFAEQWFDAINAVAEEMDVAFFFGHNHNYDNAKDYYYAKGSKMPVATKTGWSNFEVGQGYKPSCDLVAVEKTLNFTHMCTGYMEPTSTGSYSETGTRRGVAVAVTIDEDSIKYTTYDKDGVYDGNFALDVDVEREFAVAPETVEDTQSKTTVSAPGVTGITVDVSRENPDTDLYKAYVLYDIELDGYTQGDVATVSIELDESFSRNGKVVVYDIEKETSSTEAVVDGVVTFKTNHFSRYAVAELIGPTTVEGTVSVDSRGSQVTTLSNGKAYYIGPDQGNEGTLSYVANDNGLRIENGASDSYIWFYDKNGFYYLDNNEQKRWLVVGNNTAGTSNKEADRATVSSVNEYDAFTISKKSGQRTYYLNRYGGENSLRAAGYTDGSDNAGSRWRVYEAVTKTVPVTLSVSPISIRLTPQGGTSAYYNEVNPGVTVNGVETSNYTLSYESADSSIVEVTDTGVISSVWTGAEQRATTVKVTLSEVNGTKLTSDISINIQVTVGTKAIESITIDSYEGTVEFGRPLSTQTGSNLIVKYADGTEESIPVTLEMLTDYVGNQIVLDHIGTYRNLIVRYGDTRVATDYVLHATDIPYPNPGSVTLDKSAEGVDFQNTGVARVKLSAAGIPDGKGVDVIVMLDMSSSMTRCIYCSNKKDKCTCASYISRVDELKHAMKDFENTLLASPNKDDIRVAVVDFNGFYRNTNSPYYRDPADIAEDANRLDGDSKAKIYTNNGNGGRLDADAFVSPDNLKVDSYTYSPSTGTNYDYAFDAIYQLGYAIKQENEGKADRDLVVLFMSDGAPNQYNYYHAIGGNSPTDGSDDWNYWLQGNIELNNGFAGTVDCQTHTYYYDESNGNQHRMANAIKGSPDQKYEVIRKSNKDALGAVLESTNETNMYMLPGLGADMYSVGFYISNDGAITKDSVEYVLNHIPSASGAYYSADEEGKLAEVFKDIATNIANAASNARFIDQMGSDYNLQMNPTIKTNATGTITTTETNTDIVITTQSVYETHHVGKTVEGHLVTEADVGKTYGSVKTIETVSFAMNGDTLKATTNAGGYKLPDGTTVVANSTDIIQDGIICGKNFFYNSSTEEKQVKLANGTTVDLPGETFYWNIGIISAMKYTMEYTVYLDGALEGNAKPGTYDTNNYARLYYINYIGKEAVKEVRSPYFDWLNSQVKYGFYLVDAEGNPLHEDGTLADNFADAYKLTEAELYKIFLLNNQDGITVNAKELAELEDGYALYAEDAAYTVKVGSGDGQGANLSQWVITGDPDKTTYVTDYNGTDYSNAQTENTTTFKYDNTTVWFAVKYDVEINPDTIVLDYGKDIQENILENDAVEGWTAEVVGFVEYDPSINVNKMQTNAGTETFDGDYGQFSITDSGEVNYSLRKMLSAVEKVFCVVKVSKDANNFHYRYNLLNVIPATSVYYENDFNDFITYTDGGAKWAPTGEKPGRDNLQDDGTVGTNEAYGYDSSYLDDVNYSNGNAMAISTSTYSKVDGYNKTYATFTFTGTGFDLISMTSQQSGMIRADIYEGAAIEEGERFIKYAQVANVGASTLYQIPVISYEGLDYGTYTVKLHVYNSYQNTTTPELSRGGQFHFDALRVYDPINVEGELAEGSDAAIAKAAYVADEEAYNKHFEVREAIISAADFNATTEGTAGDGVVYIDASAIGTVDPGENSNTTSNSNATVQDYVADGPNNETYLINNSAAIGFVLNVDKIPKSLQIGAKSVLGNDVMLDMYIVNPNTIDEENDYYGDTAYMLTTDASFNHASAQNYSVFENDEYEVVTDFTPYFAKQDDGSYQTYVYIKKFASGDENDNSILSITDFKATFAEESGMRVTYNDGLVSAYNLRNGFGKEEEVTSDVELYSAAFTKASVRYTNQATLNVETSANVKEIVLVNEKGSVMTAATTVETVENGNSLWTLKFNPGNVGVRTFTVYGVAEDGSETERATVSIEATRR